MNGKRLIEVAFPLEQASIDSVHEKTVRHGHISTLHLWPARRPLAACRAALIATLLADPNDRNKRDEILTRLGGAVTKTLKKKKLPSGKVEEIEAKETIGGVLNWGRESGPDYEWFRQEVRKAYGGRAPKVLDPFAGGGAIPLEAMRLGCDVTAIDINPVAWFILKCTLEYPQKLLGQTRALPSFVLREPAFMESYIKNQLPIFLRTKGVKESDIKKTVAKFGQATLDPAQAEFLASVTSDLAFLEADLPWHVRAWGHWVLRRARRELASFYPTYAEFCSVKPYARVPLAREDEDQLKLVPTNEDGEAQVEFLNAGFDKSYLNNDKNPRWIAKQTVAYLWTRTTKCKACRAVVPLLKTRWLCKKDNERVILTMQVNADKSGVVFGIDPDVKQQGGNPAQRREYDKRVAAGTMSRAGAQCPCCGTIMTMADLRLEGQSGRLAAMITVVAVDGLIGKEYRLPTKHEIEVSNKAEIELARVFKDVPFGLPEERLAKSDALGFRVPLYGLDQWRKLFTSRQLLALGVLIRCTRAAAQSTERAISDWQEPVAAYLAAAISRLLDYANTGAQWKIDVPTINHYFVRFALPMTWDYAEGNVLWGGAGSYLQCADRVMTPFSDKAFWSSLNEAPTVLKQSATHSVGSGFDVVLTDPPYYDAIPYSDLMDFFYVWLRRTLYGVSPQMNEAFAAPLSPKWDREANDGELIDDSSRFDGNSQASKKNYEDGMARAFASCHDVLKPDGRLVVVFAHKHPDAWETLVAAIIRTGFVVDGSWPIQTEQASRMRAISSAALSSSVWLVCRKRDPLKRAGWDTEVLKEMEINIKQRLRDFWDAGIRGPDFVWAATGPALEAYSQYPAVKKATETGALMTVDEFLRHVRRLVVDFVVGRVLIGGDTSTGDAGVSLDDVTTYYLLHRNDFGTKDAPAGACILYAVSCGLSERLLADQYEILFRGKSEAVEDAAEVGGYEAKEVDDESAGSGGQFKLRLWNQRKHRNLGVDPGNGRQVPLIDQVHKVMQLWKAGDENRVNDYLDQRGLRRSGVFAQLLQALIEKSRSEGQTEECAILEKLSNHLRKIGATAQGALSLNS